MTLLKKLCQYYNRAKERRKATTLDMVLFLRQFATLMQAGIPLITCCDLLEKSQAKYVLRKLIQQIKSHLLTGQSLHQAIQPYPLYFNYFTRKMIEIGEQTGQLNTALMNVAHYHEKKLALIKKIQQTLFYPCLLLTTALMITLCLLLFVVPHFITLFADTKTTLPLLTLYLFTLAVWMKKACLPMGLFIIVSFTALAWYSRKRSITFFEHLKQSFLQLPLIATLWQKIMLTQFIRNLSLSLHAGISLTDALTLTINQHHTRQMSEAIAKVRHQINTGLPLHQGMVKSDFFPTTVIQMIKIGEESGMLENMLDKAADFFEVELNQQLATLTTLVEPLIMLIIGVLIGGLVIGMYLPIFKLGSAL